jgi:hypothetical protein
MEIAERHDGSMVPSQGDDDGAGKLVILVRVT